MALLCNYSVVDYCTVYTTLDYNAALEGKQSKGISYLKLPYIYHTFTDNSIESIVRSVSCLFWNITVEDFRNSPTWEN